MWTYEQSTGFMTYSDGALLDKGYAGGNKGKNPEGKNNPTMQGIPNVGPLPRGKYTMMYVVEQHAALGPYAIFLQPDMENEMFGRSDFFVHGDRIGHPGTASEGCIVLSRAARGVLWESTDHRIEVIA